MSDRFMQTLFIGETEHGYYGLNSFVDKKTNVFQLKSIGPLLMDGLSQSSNQDSNVLLPRLPEDIDLKVSVYQTTSGEFLLLGHHDIPPLLRTTTIDGAYFPHWSYVNYQQGKRLISSESNDKPKLIESHSEENWEELFYRIWRKSPKVVIGFFASIFFLCIFAVYHYARYSVLSERTIASGSQPPSHNPTNSSRRTFFEPGESSSHGMIHIGKLSYSTLDVLGSGCGGTKVFKGTFDGRNVAIKRVISDQTKMSTREIELLRKSDAHQNVVRYFCSEVDETFSYLALELCDCSLDDYVKKTEIRERYSNTEPKELLRQATDGVSHLHSMAIVHRDLKPQNILISTANKGIVRAKISDFGLCKQAKLEHASMSKASGLFGTDGWIAPEVLRSDLNSITFGVDVFSLGCIFYYVISGGKHPFGIDALNRQMNIRSGKYNLKYLIDVSDYVAINVIEKMIESDPKNRPSVHAITNHPIFWSKDRQLQFFMDVSDRIEKEDEASPVMKHLESEAILVVKNNWVDHICQYLKEDLCRHRSYLGYTVKDLLRAMRNKKHHYRELTEDLRHSLGPIPDKFVSYFTDRFPHLLIHCYKVMALCGNESIFFTYYPEESKSFCGRLIQEQINSGFMTITRSTSKNAILKRQNLTTPSSPQTQKPTKSLPAEFDPRKPPPNWRAETAPPTISILAPPGFEQQSPISPGTTEQHKPRRRRRHKKGNSGLFEVLNKNLETLDADEEEKDKET